MADGRAKEFICGISGQYLTSGTMQVSRCTSHSVASGDEYQGYTGYMIFLNFFN